MVAALLVFSAACFALPPIFQVRNECGATIYFAFSNTMNINDAGWIDVTNNQSCNLEGPRYLWVFDSPFGNDLWPVTEVLDYPDFDGIALYNGIKLSFRKKPCMEIKTASFDGATNRCVFEFSAMTTNNLYTLETTLEPGSTNFGNWHIDYVFVATNAVMPWLYESANETMFFRLRNLGPQF